MDWITGEYELFEVTEPAVQTLPFVYNSPHSGRCYPISFLESARLDLHEIRRSEDHFVDELFAAAPDIGAPLLKANFPARISTSIASPTSLIRACSKALCLPTPISAPCGLPAARERYPYRR